jgi:hypothetical protein
MLRRRPSSNGAERRGVAVRIVVGPGECRTASRPERCRFGADRHLIGRKLIIAALGGLTGALPVRAEEDVADCPAYQSTPKGLFSWAVCSFFIRPRSCKVVSSDISSTGCYKFFDLPD